MRKKKVSMLALVLMLAGCTHTVSMALRQDFAGNLRARNELAEVRPAVTFSPGDFADRRPNPGQLASFKQGVHTYIITEERPIQDAVFEGLQALATASGHQWSDTGSTVKVNLEFVNAQAARNAGFINVGATSSVQIKLDFVNAATGRVIYTQIYSGQDERSQALIGMMEMVKASVDASIISCIQSVGDDANLARALEGSR